MQVIDIFSKTPPWSGFNKQTPIQRMKQLQQIGEVQFQFGPIEFPVMCDSKKNSTNPSGTQMMMRYVGDYREYENDIIEVVNTDSQFIPFLLNVDGTSGYIANISRTKDIRGKFVVQSVIRISKWLGLEMLYIRDWAMINCRTDTEILQLNLSELLLLTSGKTFYERFGFIPNIDNSVINGVTKDDVDLAAEKIKKTKLTNLISARMNEISLIKKEMKKKHPKVMRVNGDDVNVYFDPDISDKIVPQSISMITQLETIIKRVKQEFSKQAMRETIGKLVSANIKFENQDCIKVSNILNLLNAYSMFYGDIIPAPIADSVLFSEMKILHLYTHYGSLVLDISKYVLRKKDVFVDYI